MKKWPGMRRFRDARNTRLNTPSKPHTHPSWIVFIVCRPASRPAGSQRPATRSLHRLAWRERALPPQSISGRHERKDAIGRFSAAPQLTFPTFPVSTCTALPRDTPAQPPLLGWANICYCLVVFVISCLAGKLPSWLSTCRERPFPSPPHPPATPFLRRSTLLLPSFPPYLSFNTFSASLLN